MWNEITCAFPNFNGCTIEAWEWISNYTHTLLGMWLLIHAVIRVNHVVKEALGGVALYTKQLGKWLNQSNDVTIQPRLAGNKNAMMPHRKCQYNVIQVGFKGFKE